MRCRRQSCAIAGWSNSGPDRRGRRGPPKFRCARRRRGETLAGLSGLGDLILSCSSPQSRNFAFGIALGRGEAPNRDKLAEGEFTAPVLIELAASQNVDMPVSNAVAAILSGKVTIDAAIEGLLTRPFKAEE